MSKGIAIALVIVLLALIGWVGFQSSDVTIVVNGETLRGPAKLAAEGWGLLVGIVGLFCAAILLTFVFAGIGLILLGVFVLAGLVLLYALGKHVHRAGGLHGVAQHQYAGDRDYCRVPEAIEGGGPRDQSQRHAGDEGRERHDVVAPAAPDEQGHGRYQHEQDECLVTGHLKVSCLAPFAAVSRAVRRN